MALATFVVVCCFPFQMFASAGTLDTTFNNGGIQPGTNSTFINNILNNSEGYGIAIQADGKTVVVGLVAENGIDKFAIARFTTTGVLDTTFNSAGTLPGTVSTAIDSPTNFSEAYGVAIQTDGKIVVSGFVIEEGLARFAVARFNSDGSLDATFNSAGTLPGTVSTPIDSPTNNSYGYYVAFQSDGKIVVAGDVTEKGINKIALARFNSDGTLDTTFNNGGTLPGTVSTTIDDVTNPTFSYSLAVQSDDKIVVVGQVIEGGITKFGIVRFNSNGTLDTTTFNSGGTLPGTFSTFVDAVGNSSFDSSYKIAIQADGKIVSTGLVIEGGIALLAVVRYNTDGSLDATFNPSGTLPGTLSIPIGMEASGSGVAVQTDGKILISGISTTAGISEFTVVRLTSDGTLDSSFNSDGTQPGVATTTVDNDPVAGEFAFANIALQVDGKIVIGGYQSSLSGPSRFIVARFFGDQIPTPPTPTPTSIACSLRLINKYGPRL